MPGRCDVCKTPCPGDLCPAHEQALRERPDEHPAYVHRYAQAGLDRLVLSLLNHERFAAWLSTHEEEQMSDCKCVKHYTKDDGDKALALLDKDNGDGTANYAVYESSNGTWFNANSVPHDSDRLS